ncbi:hypothetical protein SAMN04488511_10312 [Pedobacter suwonensis]|uniref:Lipoprotein n=1 Tax=Pedobacter suwonensis TaxID=332999 RepID=A0A1I0SRS7_9SPHI|nr:hypothetical protein [Pedobacter suwonensis]SFA42201.1 hypothetical protein SAMN04488511_10312 [Pedobacter suwonensis]
MKTELIKCLAACTLLLSACATPKSKKMLHEQDLEVKHDSRESNSEQSWAKSNTLLLDTSNSEYVVQITPLGKFFYSAEKGFEGMAEKVVFRGKANHRRILQGQQQKGRQLAQQKTRVKSTALKTKVQYTEKTRKSLSLFFWTGLGVVFCLALGCRLMKKR